MDSRIVSNVARSASKAQQRSSEPFLISVEEAAFKLGIGRTLCYTDLVSTGVLESVMIGKRRLVVLASLHEYVERLRGR